MKLAIPKERRPGENRVAASPDTVNKLSALGFDVAVETGAGLDAAVSDDAFKEAGAAIAADEGAALKDADIVFKIQRPTDDEIKLMKKGAMVVAIMAPHNDPDTVAACAKAGLTTVAMELMPRITRAQSMDVLSSQSNLAGYRAVIDAASAFPRAFPMMMTAAGTVPPAKAFVMGAGVAGLQAIATAKRLGAIVSATDVRRAAAEQVQSLGGKFIMVETEADMETKGGYAKELSPEDQKKQAELVAEHIKGQDIVITTALIPGRPAPRLITQDMVKSMKPGSVIIDLAVEAGGNVEGAKADETVDIDGVKVIGYSNMAGRVAVNASALFARNLLNFIQPLVDSEGDKPALKLDWEDEILKAVVLTRDGEIVHPDLKK
ncbi:MAG: Re/Si-specific NAD(P)(+) transhydrogenase subunit alpha [Alphaproteobacteria bacterium]